MKNALREAIEERGYATLTPVQEAVLAPELVNRDLLVSAQTGSGKTIGFGLAIAPGLLGDAEQFDAAGAPLALVIAPTRELALQVKRELSWLYAKAGAMMASCVGGMDMRDERRALARGAHIVVSTPGRLRDHIMRGSIDLSSLRAVVLDEADEMLDLGFREDLEFILGEAPEERQTLLFSATVPKAITHLAKSYQKDAERVIAQSENAQHSDIQYRAMTVAERDTENAVINTLRFYESPNAIVFGNTRAIVNRLTTRLSNRGFKVVALSGELSQAERTHALQAMRDGRAQVCVATDVAARGIDLPNLDLVVHAELPSNHETLLHRSGRTGRAGRKGVSALIVTKKTQKKAQRILGMAKLKADWTSAPSAEEVNARDEDRLFADPDWHTPIAEAEEGAVAKLTSSFTVEQLAAAYMRLYRSMRTAPEELSEADAKPAPRKEFGNSVWFSVSGGHDAGAEPRRLLPMLCKAGDLTKDDIGAIRVRQDQSYVQVLESSVPAFLAAIGPAMTLEEGAVLNQIKGEPNLGGSGGSGHKGGRKPHAKKPAPHERTASRSMPDAVQEDAPKQAWKSAPKPAAEPAPKSTPPVNWDDDPAPRVKKPKPKFAPKPGAKPGQKSGHKPGARPDAKTGGAGKNVKSKPYHKASAPASESDGAHEPLRRKSEGGKPDRPYKASPHKAGGGRKGPPPPASKPSSKKNKARTTGANMKDTSKRAGPPRHRSGPKRDS